MKFLAKLLVGALLCSAIPISAQDCCPTSWNSSGECCNFSVYGEFLYWDFCTLENERGAGNGFETLQFASDYQPGYRVGGSMDLSCWQIALRYTSLETKKSVSGATGSISFEQREQQFDYSVLDIIFGAPIGFSCLCGSFTPYVGVKLAWIDGRSLFEQINSFSYIYTNDFSGYGLTFGTSLRLKIWESCLPTYFVTDISCSLLKGKFKTENLLFISPTGTLRPLENACSILFVPEIYVGLNFDLFQCNCFEFTGSIGYEAQLWTSYMFIFAGANDSDRREVGSLGINGLVARLAVSF